ncbi:MAG: type I restriction enzyme HsdR N-terminal domain-containing protein [Treponematales bacterium]
MDGVKQQLFAGIDFDALASGGDFNEADVRAAIIEPLLRELGFTGDAVAREKALLSPYLKTGSTKRPVRLIPDFALKVGDRFAWVLDAKRPGENIASGDNVEQVYCYAAHPEIRSAFFALCNGAEFAAFRTTDTEKPVLYFPMGEIDRHWEFLANLLSYKTFSTGKTGTVQIEAPKINGNVFDYAVRPLLNAMPVRKQQAKRYFGCNAYFTRQAWDVVAAHIKNFSQKGDVILDPFGGSGITVIESVINGRKGIHVDLNPLSVFITRALLAPINLGEFAEAFFKVKKAYMKVALKTDAEIDVILSKYEGPKNLKLPKGSDVETVEQLFSKKQIAELALLKSFIMKEKDENIRLSLLLAFYNTISIINKTFHETPHGGGNHFGYYYRYRLARKPVEKNTMEVFENKFKRISNGKQEIEQICSLNQQSFDEVLQKADIKKGTATDLSFLPNESVDYIYTDPPYGAKIAYLDLSTIWNAWLDLDVTDDDFNMEAIEGGEHHKTKDDYNLLLRKSIQEMYRVLKFDRWLSFVFAHKDPEFWHLIVNTAEKCGFEYVGSVPQNNGQTSFKKRQRPFIVLAGELIIYFRKVRNPRTLMQADLGMAISDIILETVEGIIAKNDGATLEEINTEVIVRGMELSFLDLLAKEYTDLAPLLNEHFDYDRETEKYHIRKNTKIKAQIPLELRIRYYLLCFMQRLEREGKYPTFDEIVFNIMPLLKNGVTPEHQTILTVLQDIAERTGENGWKLKKEQGTLFEGV